MKRFLFTGMVFIISLVISNNALATDTDVYANILKKLDGIACTQPEKLPDFYGKDLVILVDDKRALLENRVKDYRQMMADFRGLKCQVQRQVPNAAYETKLSISVCHVAQRKPVQNLEELI